MKTLPSPLFRNAGGNDKGSHCSFHKLIHTSDKYRWLPLKSLYERYSLWRVITTRIRRMTEGNLFSSGVGGGDNGVPHHHPIILLITGPMSFSGGTPVFGPMSLLGMYPSPGGGGTQGLGYPLTRTGLGYPPSGQDWGNPLPNLHDKSCYVWTGHPADGTPLAVSCRTV